MVFCGHASRPGGRSGLRRRAPASRQRRGEAHGQACGASRGSRGNKAGSGIQMQKRSSLKREGCAANHGRGEEGQAVALASERRGSRSRQSATRPPLS
jgi:hypothetical protein